MRVCLAEVGDQGSSRSEKVLRSRLRGSVEQQQCGGRSQTAEVVMPVVIKRCSKDKLLRRYARESVRRSLGDGRAGGVEADCRDLGRFLVTGV